MGETGRRLRHLAGELKRRNVYRVTVAYLVAAFVVLQVAGLAGDAFGLPDWFQPMVWVVCALGLPLAVVLAWAFELTPEGVQRTPREAIEGEPAAAAGGGGGGRALGVLALLLVGAGAWYLAAGDEPASPGPAAADSARDAPGIGERSIAVLPFESLGQSEPGIFTAGMHDALLTRLSNVSGLKVISRTSVQQYRNTDKTVAEIARELGVSWVLEGGVQEMSGQIQVNAQLVDPRTDTHAWAESYRRDLTAEDLFDIQTEITKRIAESLEARLSRAERERVERQPTEHLEAYRLYLEGRPLIDQRTEPEIRAAADYFERAIREDSAYALAWSGLADARSLLWFYDYAPAAEVSEPALRAAERAVELEPGLAEAHTSLGIVRSLRQEGPSSLEHLLRAADLKPSYAEAHIWLSWVYVMLGRPGEALAPARRAVEIDPLGPAYRAYRAEALLASDRSRDALDEASRATELRPEYGLGHFVRGLALQRLGRHGQAETAFRRARSLVPAEGAPTHAEIWAAIGAARAAAGDTSGARAMLDRIDAGRDPFSHGLVRAAVGDDGAAFRAFERVETWGSFTNEHIRYDFAGALAGLRGDPRFQALLGRLNRAWGLASDGGLPG